MKHVKKYNNYLNEAHIDDSGDLNDMDYEMNSDDLWSDEDFLKFTNKNLQHGEEMPEEMYKMLSDHHKELYRKELLDFGGQLIGWSNNESLLKDLVEYNYDKLEQEVIEWVELYPEMGDEHFPMDSLFIKNIDEILQGRIIQKLIDIMEWDIIVPVKTFNSFHPRVQKLIEDNAFKPFVIK